jgi:hypothetical protein
VELEYGLGVEIVVPELISAFVLTIGGKTHQTEAIDG